MNISIIGTGYVGLVSGVCMAEKGHQVVCVDNDRGKVDSINNCRAPIHEKGLDELLQRNVGSQLSATEDLARAVIDSDITFIAVGTPFDGKKIDLSYIKAAAEQVGHALAEKSSYHVVVVKSTVIPGTTDSLVRESLEKGSGKLVGTDIGLGMNPEFLTEGTAVQDFMFPDRIVIGGSDKRSRDRIAEVYAGFESVEKIETNCKTAEMIKYTSNSVLATMISFSNEIASLCTALGDIDVVDVMRGVHAATYFTFQGDGGELHRAGITSFLGAGCGFGGSCLPKDVKALTAQGNDHGLPMSILTSVININMGQPDQILALAKQKFPELNGVRIAILGLAFKPDTDDIRETPAFPIIRMLLEEGAEIYAYDPVAMDNARQVLGDTPVEYADSLRGAVANADIVILVTSWAEFGELDKILEADGARPLVIDGRRFLDKTRFENYRGIGLRE
jgi:UDPglucose 6-dehydrogenase